jgi:dextranase
MKKNLLWSLVLCLILILSCQSSFAQYPFYFSSGDFAPPASFNQAYAYGMGTVANTNIQGSYATVIGNAYFRFFSANSGGTIYEPSGNVDSLIPLNTPFGLEVAPTINKAYYFQTFDTSTKYIFKTSGSGAPGTARCAVIPIHGPVQYVTGLIQYPSADVYPGEDVTITATISDTFSPGQGVYLRWSTDGYITSTIVPMTGSGRQYTATIPASVNVSGAASNYYVFTSGDSLTIAGPDADLMTVNLYNNNFLNFTYYVDCPFALSNTYIQMLQTDKARYDPSDVATLTASFQQAVSGNLIVKYWHLGDSIGQNMYTLTNASTYTWAWQTPATDYSGYFVQVMLQQSGANVDSASIAIDVSSLYNHFPRYGFLSQYSPTDPAYTGNIFSRLNRYHLNAIQFYDVNNKHDVPLAGTVANPDTVWNDIANRENYLSTVTADINAAHLHNMLAMNYNLLYGAWSATAVADGVSPTWGLYDDAHHTTPWGYTLPASWASNLIVENPADSSWQQFLFGNELNLFQAISYDGWHIDQLGDPGTVYDYNGNVVDVSTTFAPYIQAAKSHLGVNLVMNSVANYGQHGIAMAPVDFLYTEVWDPYVSYNDLTGLIAANNAASNNTLATVLAAYVNQPLSGSSGKFNTPGVLLADAAIFSAGGAHIELGDHMLGNPYFPNSNLRMSCGLEQNMIQYYDFLTGYENLLRDSITSSIATLQTSGNNPLSTTATLGDIWVQSTQRTNTQIFQLINLTGANTLNWRDSFGTQPAPTVLTDIAVSFTTTRQISKVFVASPDWNNGLPQQISYTISGGILSTTVPYLSYWTMLVIDYTPIITTAAVPDSLCAGSVVRVPFTVSSSFDGGNVFTAQISDSTGSFSNPVNIGTISGTGGDTISANLPPTAHGAAYRIRVVASQPAAIGADDGTNITIIPTVNPTISISAFPGTSVCAGINVSFTATTINAGSQPGYQWKVNGVNAGADASSFGSSTLADSDVVYCVLTSSATCTSAATAISDSVTMAIHANLVPGDSISANPSGAVCSNSNVVFTVHPVNGGASPGYSWEVNGVATGTNSPIFNSATLQNGDVVSCVMTSAYICPVPDTAIYSLTMSVSGSVTPTISISESPAGAFCAGTAVVFRSSISGGGSNPAYQWQVNGTGTAGTADTLSLTTLVDGDIVHCILTSSSSCASVLTATSNSDTANINPVLQPTISINPSLTAMCAGNTDTFTANITNGGSNPTFVWKKNGSAVGTSNSIDLDSLLSSDVISCTLTSDALCASPTSSTSTNVSITVNPLPNATITPTSAAICQGDSVELSAPAGNTSYRWSGANGNTSGIFVSGAGSYEVTVTNASGCSAVSSPVVVTVHPLPVAPMISYSNDSLYATVGVTYHWYLNGSAISNATNPNLLMTQDGQYQVQITDSNGCSNISAIYNEINLGVQNILAGVDVKLYPNPNNGSFVLAFSDHATHIIDISDELGRVMMSDTQVIDRASIDLANISVGVYFLNIHDDGHVRSFKFSIVK